MTAHWKLKYDPAAAKWLKKADKKVAERIRNGLRSVEKLEDPRSRGKGLTGTLAGLWRYRVGDYRIVCDIIDNDLIILAIEIDHRSRIYRD